MFEWLKNLLFDEEVEEIQEDKLEKIDFTRVDNLDNIVSETPEQEEKNEVKEEVKEVVKEVVEEPTPVKKNEFNIQLNEPVKKEVKPQVETKPRREREKTQTEQKEVYIGSVISPIFGGKETKTTNNVSKPVSTMKRKDSLGTVISPMYGQAELLNHEKEARAKIQEIKNEPIIVNDDWKNDIPLEELISNDVENTDCVQFSLFGDEQTINE